jgi:sodium/potassium-transporting ATPase subunit alpha
MHNQCRAGTPDRERALPITRLTEQEVYRELSSTAGGLSEREAAQRLATAGPNTLQAARGVPLWTRFARHFTHFLAILLWVAAGLSFLAEMLRPGEGMAALGWAILGVILINAIFSFVQEYKAERAVQALRRLLPTMAWVKRDGRPRQVPHDQVVPGDVLLLEEGEQVAADARLVEAIAMRVDMASLTGEAKPKRRTADPVAAGTSLEAPNLVFAGTTVLSGRGRAIVYATGMRTEFGRIAHLAAAVQPGLSPLQKEIRKVTHLVALLSLAMGALFFVIGMSGGMGVWTSAIFGIGIIVANVPEGLLPTVTLALAMGSQRMAKRKALIKQLTSVETLGCTTVICTDKTGTLTENRLRVERLYVDGREVAVSNGRMDWPGQAPDQPLPEHWRPVLRAMALCHNAKPVRRKDHEPTFTGDPTEVALVDFARHAGGGEELSIERFPRMSELPFDADRKRMTTVHWVEGRLMAFVKGAPELVLPLCTDDWQHASARAMTPGDREHVLVQNGSFARQAYRVLALAMREIEPGVRHLDIETVERDLTFLGLVAMMDPPHAEVPGAVARCRQAGVRVIMITGDHPLTALAIARKIGLAPGDTEASEGTAPAIGRLIEGAELDAFSDEDLRRRLMPRQAAGAPSDPIFARMAPRHKMRVVSVLKEQGEIVAVTGDGVNDAPALQKADIGIAMGVAGTDVAKETADMILLDDNFSTIINAIEEGRAVYANIRKFVTYILASNVPEIVPYLAFGLFRAPLALTIPQILAVDLGTDMVPALALGAERPDPAIMNVPPRPRAERLVSLGLLIRAYGFLGTIEAAIAMGCFFWFLRLNGWTWGAPLDWADPLYRKATALTLAAIVIAQVANVFACRSERVSLARLGFLTNSFILWGILVEMTLLIVIVYTPPGNAILGTAPLPLWAWIAPILGASGLLLAEEIRKLAVRHRPWRSGSTAPGPRGASDARSPRTNS